MVTSRPMRALPEIPVWATRTESSPTTTLWPTWTKLSVLTPLLIKVFPKAQQTDGYQANRNLILEKTARADSIPGLEIEADDVRCTHGATVSQLDPDEVFYIRSRGLPFNETQRLIVQGFFAPVIDRIPLPDVRERLTEEIVKKIG